MKKKGTLIGAAALTFAIGGGMIFGNAALATQTMAAGNKESVNQVILLDERTETAQQQAAVNTLPVTNRVSTGMVTLENGATIIIEYYFDESDSVVKANVTAEGFPEGRGLSGNGLNNYMGYEAEQQIKRIVGVEQFRLWAEENGVSESVPPVLYVEAEPSTNDIVADTAITAAIEMLVEKYALKQETIERFTVTAKFYTQYEDIFAPVWWINLYPINVDDYPEIGCYWALICSKTGEVFGLYSAVDGRG